MNYENLNREFEINNKKEKNINVVCKILLILSYVIMISCLFLGEINIFFPSILLIITTIGILKTAKKKTNIFLILGIIALVLGGFIPLVLVICSLFIIFIINLFGGVDGLSYMDGITKVPELISGMNGGFLPIIILIIIGLSFIIIHNKKFKKTNYKLN